VRGKTRVELGARGQHPETIGTDDPHPLGARRLLARLCKRAGTVSEPGRDDDRGRNTHVGRLRDHHRHGGGRRRDDDEVGWRRQLGEVFDRWHPVNRVMVRIDEVKRTGPTAGAEIIENGPSD
jgi:hypothetical protein